MYIKHKSTIFKTKTDDFGRIKTGLNDGIKDAVTGIFNGNFFKRQNLLSDSDITAIKAYNAEIDKCTTSQTAFYRTMQNTSKEAQNVVAAANGNKVALDGLTKSSKAAELGMKALSMAGNMLLIYALTSAVDIIYKCATASDRLAESASQMGSEFASTKSDISDYKTKIEELYQTINDDTSSYEDTYNARQELLKIQDEMIDKFGDEADAVKLVTDAINGQTDSLDTLTQDKWQETVNAFNSDRGKGWTEKVADAFANIGHGNNFQRMIDEMEDTKVTFHMIPMYGDDTYEEFSKKLKEDFGADITRTERDDAITLSGDLDTIHKQLLNIQTLAKGMGIDDTFLNDLGNQADEAKSKLDEYQEMYSQYVLYDKVLSDTKTLNKAGKTYEESFNEINKACEKYQEAFASGNEDAIAEAKQNYAEIVQSAIEGLDSNDSVIDYFNNMYPDLQEVVGGWEFEVKFKAAVDDDKDDFENEVKDAVSQFNTVEDIKNYNPKVATEEQKDAYLQLKQYADDYGLTLDQLIDKLEQMGLLQSQSKSDLLNKLVPSKNGLTAGVSSALSDTMAGVDADEATKWVDSLTEEEAKLANSPEFDKALEKQKEKINSIPESFKEAQENLEDEYQKISDWGLDDYADQIKNNTIQTKFGNVDMDKRTIIHWSDELKQAYADALASWDYDPEVGSIDTVFGGSERFGKELNGNGWEVAFTPILPDGTFLSKDTVEEYINSILEEAYADDGKVTEDELTAIDAQGRQVGNTFVQGIFAGIDDSQNYDDNGNWAETIGRLMHFSGDFGAVSLAKDAIDEESKSMNAGTLSAENYSAALQDVKDSQEGISDETPISFKQSWKDLDSTDDDKLKSLKKDLTDLAESGKLTEKSFNKTSGAKTWLKSLDIDADTAVSKINKLVDSSKPLSSLKSGISQLQTALAEKKENKVVGADTLNGMESEFGKLDSWKKYKETLGSTTSTLQQCRDVQNKLATEYVNSNNFLSQLVKSTGKVDDATKQYYISQLKDLGIKNAEDVVSQQIVKRQNEIAQSKSEAAIDTKTASVDFENATQDEVDSLVKETEQLDGNTKALKLYLLQKMMDKDNAFNTEESVNNLIRLAKACGASESVIKDLKDSLKDLQENGNVRLSVGMDISVKSPLKNTALTDSILPTLGGNAIGDNVKDNGTSKSSKKAKKKNKKDIETIISEKISEITNSSGGVNVGDKKDSKNKSSNSTKSKQEIDWIERRITILTNKVSLLNAQKENLFTVKSKNKNLNKQLKETTKLINTYNGAYYKYIAKANSVKLSGSLKKLVRNGKVTGSYKDLVKKYGEKTANRIQSYENYYDKAQSAKQSKADAIKQRRELKVEKNQNYVDKYNAKTTYNELLASDTHYTAKVRNGYINKEIKATEKSYKYQIKIAKINKDITEQKRLQAELEQKINELNKTKFDNIVSDYEHQTQLLEYSFTEIDNEIANIEASGRTVAKSYYLDKKKLTSQRAEILKHEKADLENSLKSITYGSDEYYDALSKIKEIDTSLTECTKSQYEFNSAIKELNSTALENIVSQLERFKTENDFLVDLFEHEDSVDSDTGLLTDAGKGRLWAYTTDYYTFQEQASKYEKELKRLNKLKSEGRYGADSGEFNSLEDLDKRIKEVYDSWRDNISKTYEYEKKIVDEMKSYYQKQIDVLQDLIDKKREALEAEKDLYDYQKQIKEKTQNIDIIKKQIAAYSGDTSEEAKAQLQKLKVSLEESNEDLKDTVYDKYISDQENILDNLLKEYQEFVEKHIKEFQDLLEEGIANGKDGVGYLQYIAQKNGYTIENKDVVKDGDAKQNVNAASNKIEQESQNSVSSNTSSSNGSSGSVPTRTNMSKYDDYASNKGAAPMKAYYKQEVTKWINQHVVKSKKKKKDYSYVNQKIWDTHSHKGTSAGAGVVLSTKDLEELSQWLTGGKSSYKKDGALAKELKYLGISGFSHGGIVSLKSLDKQVKANGDDGLVSVKNGEGILTPVQTEAFMKLVKNMDAIKSPKITLPDLKKMSSETNVNYGGVTFNFELENVTNAEEFIRELQTNQKLQKSIQSVSIDRLNGGGRLSVNGIK